MGSWGHVHSLILPVLTLASGAAAAVTRFTRSRHDRGALARATPAPRWRSACPRRQLLFRFALRNALIPVVTIVGLLAGGLLGGAVLVEQVFAIPGLGDMFVIAVQQKDYPTVQGVALVLTAAVIAINLLVDLLCGLARPADARLMRLLARPGLILALAFLALMVVAAGFAPVLAPYDPLKQDLAHSFAAPGLGASRSAPTIWAATC